MENKMQNKFSYGNIFDHALTAASDYFAAIGITYAFFIQPKEESILFSHTRIFLTVLIFSAILRGIWRGLWPKKSVHSGLK